MNLRKLVPNWEQIILMLLKENIVFWPFPGTPEFRRLSARKQSLALKYFESEGKRLEEVRRRYFSVCGKKP